MPGRYAPQCALKALVGSLGLAIGLGMVAGGQTHCGAERRTERTPCSGSELWAPIRDDVSGDAVETEYITGQKIPRLCSRRELRQGDKMCSF